MGKGPRRALRQLLAACHRVSRVRLLPSPTILGQRLEAGRGAARSHARSGARFYQGFRDFHDLAAFSRLSSVPDRPDALWVRGISHQ